MKLLLPAGIIIMQVAYAALANGNADHTREQAAHIAGIIYNDSIFVLNGKINGLRKGTVKLIYSDKNGKSILDSAVVRNGRFRFRGHITGPTKVFLEGPVATPDMNDPNFTGFFIDPGEINISLTVNNFKNALISGSKTQLEQQELDKSIAPVLKEMAPLSKEYETLARKYRQAVKAKKDSSAMEELQYKMEQLRTGFEPYQARIRKIEYDFFAQNPQSYVTAFQLRFYVSELPLDSLQLFYDRLGPVTQKSIPGREIEKELRQLRGGSPGSFAQDFTAVDVNGQKLSLADFKGRYVLLDFWASWCVPCRQGNPHLKELYRKYRDKGIEFIGIADDDREADKWRTAIAKDGIGHWRHVLRGLKINRNNFDHGADINAKFGIHILPTKILIDPQGIIIGRYTGEKSALDTMLKSIFKD